MLYVSDIILFAMEWLQIKFYLSVQGRLPFYKLKLFKNSFSKKNVGYLNDYLH